MCTSYGTTESGSSTHAFKQTMEDKAAWAYMKFGAHTNIRWMSQGDGTYECQFKVSGLLVCLEYKQLIDLWIRHAIHISWQLKTWPICGDMQHQICSLGIQLKNTFGSCEVPSFFLSFKILINGFASVGRIDDVLIHSSGEKTVPAPIEEVVMGST